MDALIKIKVVWNSRISGGYSAYAEEPKGGYLKGEKVAIIPCELKNFPSEISVLPKRECHAI